MYRIKIDMANLRTVELEIRNSNVEDYRLDVYVAKRLGGNRYSRTLIQRLIKEGLIVVNGRKAKPSYEINVGDIITVNLPKLILPQLIPEDIPLDIIYEDEQMLVINKPPHFVVHPAAGHWEGTLVNALLHHCKVLPQTDDIYRPGIVHRLDKDTSGIILAAKTLEAHTKLSEQFENRTISKEYLAIVEGEMRFDSDLIDKPLGRDPDDREKMRVNGNDAKVAQTVYEVLERFNGYTFVRCRPKTGRTHQIRVHLQFIGHPIIADSCYAGKDTVYEWELARKQRPADYADILPVISRQALHAHAIAFTNPLNGQKVAFSAELPDDMAKVLELLRKYSTK